MNCSETHLLLHAYVDGELDLVRSMDVEQHVKTCASCATKLNSLKSLRAALKESNLAYRSPASLRREVKQIARPTVDETKLRPFDFQWLWKWLAVGATAVAVLAITLRPFGISPNDQLLNEVVSSHVRSLMAEHLTDVVSSDQHTVKPWFAGKLDFSPDVKDFAAQDFPLVGGRLDYINGRDVAALIYRHNKHFINVFIWPVTGSSSSQQQTADYHGYHVINRDLNGFHYSLVSDMDENGLEQLADLLGH
jgi:anti-sigma factor RsiW